MKKNTHTNRFSNRHIPQVIDLELLYQLILRRWKFHCGKEKEDESWWQTLLTLSPHYQGRSWICTQPRPCLHPFPISLNLFDPKNVVSMCPFFFIISM